MVRDSEQCVYDRNHKMVRLALEKGAILATRTADGVNPFHQAIVKEQVEIVDSSLWAGADLMATDEHGRNALHIASSKADGRSVILSPGNRNKARIASLILGEDAP